MKKTILPIFATLALLFAAGCNNNTSTENQPTNAPSEQQSPMVNSNSASSMDTNNVAPSGGGDGNSAGMDMSNLNNSTATNNMNTSTNMSPP